MKDNYNKTIFVIMSLIMYLCGLGILFWSVISLSWMRLIAGIIFIFLSLLYSLSWRDEK